MSKKNFGKLVNEMLKDMPWHYASDILQDLNYLNDKGLLQKTGHWIREFNDIEGEVRFTCSSCGDYQLFETNFCSKCGAKMESEAAEL